MPFTASFRIWSPFRAVPGLAELAARQQSVTGLACAFAEHRIAGDGWVELSAVPAASPTTACMLLRSADPPVVNALMSNLRPTRFDIVHELRLAQTVYFTGTTAERTDITLLVQFGLTWALAQVTRGLIAGDTPSGDMEYWWSDAFLAQVEALRARVERARPDGRTQALAPD